MSRERKFPDASHPITVIAESDASYHSITTADGTVADAGWAYDEPAVK